MKTYIVFGMHRSGTSFLIRSLKDQGVNVGPDETDVYSENVELVHLNALLLNEAGGNWNNVPDEKGIIAAAEKHKEKIRTLIKKYKDEYWGFKDPRTSLTIGALLPYILEADDDPFLYICFRRPDKVADSLYRRDGTPKEEGRALAIKHNKRIVRFLEEYFCK